MDHVHWTDNHDSRQFNSIADLAQAIICVSGCLFNYKVYGVKSRMFDKGVSKAKICLQGQSPLVLGTDEDIKE